MRRVIITGGLGMVGQHAARNLIVHAGTFEILASGLSGRVPIIERKILDESAHKCFIQCIRCDVSNSEEMRYIVMAQHRSSWLLHASGVIQDSLIAKQTCNFMTSVMAPKAVGIHRWALNAFASPIGAVLLCSSIASFFGSSGQANYCSANKELDAWARIAKSSGLFTMSIQWGAWSSTKGMSSKNPLVLNRVKRLGFGILSPNVAFKTLSKFVMASHGDMSDIIVISPLDIVLMKAWMLEDVFHDEFTAPKQCKSKISSSPLTVPEKKKAGTEVSHIKVEELQNQICDLVEAALGYRIDIQTSLIEAGIDSLGAVELRNSILNLCENQDFRIDSCRHAFVYDFPTISAISQFLIKKASIYGENKQLNDTRTKQKLHNRVSVGLKTFSMIIVHTKTVNLFAAFLQCSYLVTVDGCVKYMI